MKGKDLLDLQFINSLEGIETIGRYQIIHKLGQGGAGIVFLCKDPFIKRMVAIKISQTATDRARERFLVEAQSAGQFNHPNIVSIHDVGVQSNFCYMTMEYIEGDTLEKSCLKKHRLPLRRVIEIALNVCSALDYSHKRGIIHRDIKPANIMIDKDGIVKIADFGIAQMTESTAVSGFFGTPSYMSPEQLKEEPIGYQSDIFSLGCVIYELLSNQKAFPGENNFSIIFKITSSEPEPISKIRPDLPPLMEDIIKKAIAKDPAERYQSCTELAYDLKVVLRGLTEITESEEIKDVVDFVHNLKFFRGFSEDQVKEIVSLSHIIKIDKGKAIVSEKEIDDTFYIIMSGQAKVKKDGKDIASLGTGDCLGEMALIGGQRRVADVIADTDCILLKIGSSLLDNTSDSVKYLFFKSFALTLVQRLSRTRSKQ
jgi:serine/threonine protein kinase